MDARLPAHLEVGGLIRQVQNAGGFAAVLQRGEREAGTILLVTTAPGAVSRFYERMPDMKGGRRWACARERDPEKPEEFSNYIDRRAMQDPDCWIVELDIPDAERFIGLSGPTS